jgi:ATP-binding cassette subfamily C protein
MSRQSFAPILDEEGTPSAVGGDRPFLLLRDAVGYVRSGRLDIFAVRVKDGEPVGPRTHLFRLIPGDPIIGTGVDPDSGLGMLAVGNPGTVVVEVPRGYLQAIFARESSLHPATEFFQGWVEHLCRMLASGRPPRNGAELQPGLALTVQAGAQVHPAAAFGWVRQLTGGTLLLNRPGCALGPGELLPIAAPGWLEAQQASELILLTTEELLVAALAQGEDELWPAVERLNRMAFTITDARLREAETTYRERARVRGRANEGALAAALARLAAPMLGAHERAQMRLRGTRPEGDEDQLFAAFRIVAEAAGIAAEAPPRSAFEGRGDRLAVLTQALRVRSRRVVLRDDWWTSDCGPLLGRLTEPPRYVALLPDKRSGYRLCDPVERTERPLDAGLASELEPFGHTFYRPFPETPLTLWAVVRFGISGLHGDLLRVVGVAALVGVLGALVPLSIKLLFGSVIPSADRGQLFQLTLILLLAGGVTAAFGMVRGIALLRLQLKAGARIQAAIWDRLIALPLRFFRDYTAGDLAVRAMNMEQIRQTLSFAVLAPLLSGVFSVFNFALLVYFDWVLALAATGMLLTALGGSLAISYLQLRRLRSATALYSRLSGLVLQLLNGIAKLKVVGGEQRAFGLWADLFGRQRQEQFRYRTLGIWLAVFSMAFAVLCTLIIFGLRARFRTDVPVGDFIAFVVAFNLCLSAVSSIGAAAVAILSVIPLYEQVRPILVAQPEVDSVTREAGELTGRIELHHLSFRYQTEAPLVIRNLSVQIRPGEFLAFVGPSGSGKSTLLRLLLGFEAPETGSIYYDEQDLAGLDVRSVRQQIGTVLQTGRVMPGDIFTNIVGSSLATRDQAWAAARMAGFAADIEAMPMGMHTMVDENGSTLSGGQRQRLLISRALVQKPRVLFFDEATSALDNRTQETVSRSLDELKATRIVVAHRLSTIRNANRICVVRAGELVEMGDYDELMAKEGLFYRMAQRQIA